MKTHLVRGVVIGAALVAVGLATSVPVGAVAATADQGSTGSSAAAASTEMVRSMQRDLRLTPEQAERRIAAQEAAVRLEATLIPRLGGEAAGSWFDGQSGKLMVAVTSAGRAEQVRAAGAEAKLVSHSRAELEAIKSSLDALAKSNAGALTGITAWHVDPQRNAVVVTVRKGQPRAAALAGLARHGDAVRVEESDAAPAPSALLRGGDRYNSCSIGFNAFSGGFRYLLTAGHCGTVGTQAFSGGVWIGPFTNSNFPGTDYAAIRVDNTAAWTSGPWINAYVPGDPNAVYNVNGHAFSPPGTAVCKSGYTTGLTCGAIKAKGETVGYDHDNNPATPVVWVFGLVRHTACVEPGDSGGSNFSWDASNRIYAEGMTSGASMKKDALGKSRCLSVFGQENVSWFSLVTEAMVLYGLSLYTAP